MRLLTNNPASIGQPSEGVKITLHRLRHTFATQLVNAGYRVTSIQKLLRHKRIDTTLLYGRVYDSTVATGYYQAMDEIEGRFDPDTNTAAPSPSTGELLAMLNTLQASVLTESQQETVRALRAAILAIVVVQSADGDGDDG